MDLNHISLLKERIIQEELVIVAAPWVQRLRGIGEWSLAF